MARSAVTGGGSEPPARLTRPRGLIVDYGGTLVEEVGYDATAGQRALLSMASSVPQSLTLDAVVRRAKDVTREIMARRDVFGIETPWVSLTRLIHDFFGTQFSRPMADLERAFWDASVTTRPIAGAKAALDVFHAAGVPIAVLSNSSFSADVIRHDLDKYGLADHLAFVMVTADYVVRKPSRFLFETAAARLGVAPADVWFVGDRLDTDVAGARGAGMKAVWLEPTGAGRSDASDVPDVPDVIVKDWAELARCFEGTSG